VQRRNAAGAWEIHEFGPGEHARLEALAASLSLDALYRDPLSPAQPR
jgi:hypothetical protein